jgi:hypothetical protein
MATTIYTVARHPDAFDFTDPSFAAQVTAVYEAYRVAMGTPDFMPPFDKQDSNVKLAWGLAIRNCTASHSSVSGQSLYQGYYDAVGGVALKNNNVKLSHFDEMDALRQNSWNSAAEKI